MRESIMQKTFRSPAGIIKPHCSPVMQAGWAPLIVAGGLTTRGRRAPSDAQPAGKTEQRAAIEALTAAPIRRSVFQPARNSDLAAPGRFSKRPHLTTMSPGLHDFKSSPVPVPAGSCEETDRANGSWNKPHDEACEGTTLNFPKAVKSAGNSRGGRINLAGGGVEAGHANDLESAHCADKLQATLGVNEPVLRRPRWSSAQPASRSFDTHERVLAGFAAGYGVLIVAVILWIVVTQ